MTDTRRRRKESAPERPNIMVSGALTEKGRWRGKKGRGIPKGTPRPSLGAFSLGGTIPV